MKPCHPPHRSALRVLIIGPCAGLLTAICNLILGSALLSPPNKPLGVFFALSVAWSVALGCLIFAEEVARRFRPRWWAPVLVATGLVLPLLMAAAVMWGGSIAMGSSPQRAFHEFVRLLEGLAERPDTSLGVAIAVTLPFLAGGLSRLGELRLGFQAGLAALAAAGSVGVVMLLPRTQFNPEGLFLVMCLTALAAPMVWLGERLELRAARRLLGPSVDGVSHTVERWRFDPTLDGSGAEAPVDVALHPCRAPRLLVMMPGWDGALDGYANKYRRLAELMQARGIAAVVRMGNHPVPGQPFETSSRAQLRGVTRQALARVGELCGTERVELFFAGVSAGASAMASHAGSEPHLTRLLLIAPSADVGLEAMRAGLEGFRGQLFVTVGAQDRVVGDLPGELLELCPGARSKRCVVVQACDHQFRGARNGRILSQAFLWAFAGDTRYPDPARGIQLYD